MMARTVAFDEVLVFNVDVEYGRKSNSVVVNSESTLVLVSSGAVEFAIGACVDSTS